MRPTSIQVAVKLMCCFLFLFAFAWPDTSAQAEQQSAKAIPFNTALRDARQVSTQLTNKLRLLLLKHVQKDNFDEGVQVCATIAQTTMQQFNRRPGRTVRRVSLRFRNSANLADDYEQQKLETFDQLNREQKLAQEYFELVEENGQAYLRYMKPLLTAPLCTNCHGQTDEIPPRVRQFLQTRYPDDQATGFRIGDVRGAVSVKILVQGKATAAFKAK